MVDNVSEEHGLTEDGKTVAPFSPISVPKASARPRKHFIFWPFHQAGTSPSQCICITKDRIAKMSAVQFCGTAIPPFFVRDQSC